MARLGPWLRLARAHSALGAALAVWVGGRLSGAQWDWWWLLPMAGAFLLSAAGNAFNDAYDEVSDRINRPNRPIPRGEITPAQARTFTWVCTAIALLLAWPFGVVSRLGTVAGAALLLLYTTHLKRIPLLGHIAVGVLTGMAVGYGGLLAHDVPAILVPAAVLGLLFGGRELIKTIHDIDGDRAQGTATVATRWGSRVALWGATMVIVAGIALLALWSSLAWPWLIAALLCATTLVPLWIGPLHHQRVAWSLRWSKVLGLAALALFAVG